MNFKIFTILRLPTINRANIQTAIVQFCWGLLGAAVLMFIFHLIEQPQRIATVDVTTLINEFVKTESVKTLTPTQLKQQTEVFGRTLDNTLKALARDQQLVIFPKEAVVSGARDMTPYVAQKLNQALSVTKS